MRDNVLSLKPGDRFIWDDPLSQDSQVLTVVSGPMNHFGSVSIEVAEWDFDFEATSSCMVEVVSDPSNSQDLWMACSGDLLITS